jgi:hypothetical protein
LHLLTEIACTGGKCTQTRRKYIPVGSHRHPWLRRFALPFPSLQAALIDLTIILLLHIIIVAVDKTFH